MMKVVLSNLTAEELVRPELLDDDCARYHFDNHPLAVDDMIDDAVFATEVADVLDENEHIYARIQYLYPRRPPMTDAKGVLHDDVLTLEDFLAVNGGWGYMPKSSFKEIKYLNKETGKHEGVIRTLHTDGDKVPQFVTTAKLFTSEDKLIRDGEADDTMLAASLSVLQNGNPWRDFGRKLSIARAVQKYLHQTMARSIRLEHVFGSVVGSERVYVVPVGASVGV